MTEISNAEHLVGILINKMESMDNNLLLLKAENDALKQLINNPQRLLRKMGLVPVSTPLVDDLSLDPFRADLEMGGSSLLKAQNNLNSMSNEDIHSMTWEEIHEMANQAKGDSQ